MRVGDGETLQHALDRAVLARTAVQHVEGDVGLERLQHGRNVAPDVDAGDAVSSLLQGVRAGACRTAA